VSYQLGIDLGTTFTAAAVHRDGRSSMFHLGSQASAIPSVVLLRSDGTELTGEAAVRRAMTEPDRVAREFKRRLGDTTPIIVGGAPYSAEQLMARMLKATMAEVAKREGGPADRVGITHPANWGPYKIDLLHQAIRLAGLPEDSVVLITEPEAAAVSYATQQRVEPGEVVAVYDLGGGTFDAAVLRRTETGFEILGRPEGIERMGGIDFDAAVFAHVNRSLDGKLAELDPDDPLVISGVSRLRDECVAAKIALSSDTDATVPVLLPGIQTEVRITRSEFESLIRPSLSDSIGAIHRALESAGVTPEELSRVLLVGGSSRIPLIAQMVSSELGRPVAVDADPKHAVALGAASFAGGAMVADAAAATTPMPLIVPASEPVVIAGDVDAAGVGTEQMDVTPAPAPTMVADVLPPAAPTTGPGPKRSKLPLILGGVAAAGLLGVGAFLLFGGGGDDTAASTTTVATATTPATTTASTAATTTVADATAVPPTDAELEDAVAAVVGAVDLSISVSVSDAVATLTGSVDAATASAAVAAAAGVDGVASVDDQLTVLLADELCTDDIMSNVRWACIESVTSDGTDIVANYVFEDDGTPWSISSDFHLHFYSDSFETEQAGAPGVGVSTGGGTWVVWDTPSTFGASIADLGGTVDRLCVRVAHSDHSLESLDSGNCFPVTG